MQGKKTEREDSIEMLKNDKEVIGGESVDMIIHPCVSRLPRHVKARRRFLLYDNACQARKFAERRYPHKVRHWTFLVDRKHWENHTTCSQAFCMDEYPSRGLIGRFLNKLTEV